MLEKVQKFNEIGSNFYLETLPPITENNLQLKDDIILLDSGRSAIRLVLEQIESEEKVAILPAYTCNTVIEPFVSRNYKVFYYDVNENMFLDVKNFKDLVNKVKPKVILVHSYFGKDTLKPVRGLLKELRKKGIYIIEDVTQILLNKNLDIQTADFVIGSIRKWCAVPDGGFIKNNSEKKIRVEKLVENIGFVNKQIEAQKVKASYVKSLDKKLKEEYTKLFRDSKEILDNNKNIYHISNITKNILKQSDFESIKEKRKNNYNYLYNNLKKFDFIKCPLGELEQEEVPLYCPILININKKEFQRFMANSDIYLPIIWPKAKEYLASLRFDCDIIYEQIICIPCDQRYDIDDMKRIILGIEEYERGYRK